MAGSLDGNRQSSLMRCTGSRDSSGKDLPALGNILVELRSILIIDLVIFSTEDTNLLLSVEPAPFLERRIRFIRFVKSHF